MVILIVEIRYLHLGFMTSKEDIYNSDTLFKPTKDEHLFGYIFKA